MTIQKKKKPGCIKGSAGCRKGCGCGRIFYYLFKIRTYRRRIDNISPRTTAEQPQVKTIDS